jgi:hypothetical protein
MILAADLQPDAQDCSDWWFFLNGEWLKITTQD